MTQKNSLQQAIEVAARSWPQLQGLGDSNTVDVYWQASRVVEICKIQLPTELPRKGMGVSLIDSTEKHFIAKSLVRDCSGQSLAERGLKLVDVIRDHGLLSIGAQESYVVALYSWHGCINMAKLLRKTYVVPGGEASYTREMRVQGYNWLRECWCKEEAKANPWVRYGVSLARLWEKNRKMHEFEKLIVEDWVPADSPYWA